MKVTKRHSLFDNPTPRIARCLRNDPCLATHPLSPTFEADDEQERVLLHVLFSLHELLDIPVHVNEPILEESGLGASSPIDKVAREFR